MKLPIPFLYKTCWAGYLVPFCTIDKASWFSASKLCSPTSRTTTVPRWSPKEHAVKYNHRKPRNVAEEYSTLLYSTLLYSTLLYSTLLYSTLLYSTLLYSTLLYSTLLYSTLLYSTLLYSTLLYSTLLYSTLLYSTLLYSTLLYSTLLYSITSIKYTSPTKLLPQCTTNVFFVIWRLQSRRRSTSFPPFKKKEKSLLASALAWNKGDPTSRE